MNKDGDNISGKAVGIEHQPELVELGKRNILNDEAALIESEKVIIIGN